MPEKCSSFARFDPDHRKACTATCMHDAKYTAWTKGPCVMAGTFADDRRRMPQSHAIACHDSDNIGQTGVQSPMYTEVYASI